MEKPYGGRAILQDKFTDLQIIIPAKRNWFHLIFIGCWLGGWLMGELFAIGAVTGLLGGNPAGLFILFWLGAWTVGGYFALRTFLWNLKGKEIITVGQGQLTIDKEGALLFKPKVYDLKEVKHLRVQDDSDGFGGLFGARRNDLSANQTGGMIRFDYGLQTVKFGIGLDEAEARFITDKLKGRYLPAESHYNEHRQN
ncbi:MAG: hypothetical protein EOO16_26180 [Chitinophagaceae bacterium]|nr:MAG: hypothetical protein EOO16_26180 [Chitinophagaceae bacterium]